MTRKLTAQEIRVLSLIALGFTNEEIAGRLNISHKTVPGSDPGGQLSGRGIFSKAF